MNSTPAAPRAAAATSGVSASTATRPNLLHLHALRQRARAMRQHQLALHVDAGVRIDLAAGNHPAMADVDDRQFGADRRRQRPHGKVAAEREAAAGDLDGGGVGVDARFVQLVVLAKRAAIAARLQPGARQPAP